MTRLLTMGALVWALASGSAFAQAAPDTSAAPSKTPAAASNATAAAAAAPNPQAQNSVKLVTVIAGLAAGVTWLSLRPGSLCIGDPIVRTWTGGRVPQDLPPYAAAFKTELEKAGYKVITPGEDNLFDEGAGAADYEAAAVITNEKIDGCISRESLFTRPGEIRGDSSMTIDWQIYSRLKKQVVAHVSTTGAAHLDNSIPGGQQRLQMDSFAANVRELASNADFRTAMSAPKGLTAGLQTPDTQSPILLAGSLKAGPRKIADAVGSVVTILNDIGSGSGVLVSSDGYVMTDAHVVGDDKQARVRWSDGFVTLGQVVRVSKNRDVAILKTDPRDRTPLAIKREPVTPGQRVYAIGSPRGKDFEGTVSSGVISADRVIDGLRYVQSDTVVSPGSSGGPLLDETGAVIGLTDLGVQNNGPAGLNLFTPIGDAMDFLTLEQQ